MFCMLYWVLYTGTAWHTFCETHSEQTHMYLGLIHVFDTIPWTIQTPILKLQKQLCVDFLLFLLLTARNGIRCLCKRRVWPHIRTNDTLYFHVSVLTTFSCPSRLAKNMYKYAFTDCSNVWKLGAVGSYWEFSNFANVRSIAFRRLEMPSTVQMIPYIYSYYLNNRFLRISTECLTTFVMLSAVREMCLSRFPRCSEYRAKSKTDAAPNPNACTLLQCVAAILLRDTHNKTAEDNKDTLVLNNGSS